MKCRLTIKRSERGIALVITLVMLAVVTVMAIVFLAVTRRERSSVKITEETAIAKDMADAALERAKTEATAGMNANGSKLHYDLFNSQAFYNPRGFVVNDGATNMNVGPVHDWPAIRQASEDNYLQLLANLQYDPAVPVFVETNQNGRGELRHYLDFNRNRQFETNGFLYDLDFNERPLVERINNQNITNRFRFVGDPEWIGILERPDFPHSETNRFVGRMAYLVLPAGKSLDLNYIHNQVNPAENLDQLGPNGFSRSQGVGSWEINMAGFLRELNGNNYGWRRDLTGYRYTILPNQPANAQGYAFDDARSLLKFRYTRRTHLKSILESLGQDNMMNPVNNAPAYEFYRRINNNNTEDFGDRPYLAASGEIFFPPSQAPQDLDNVNSRGWPGSMNTNAFTDIQQLFSVQASSAAFTSRLQTPARRGAVANSGQSSYDRYTYYRLASQLGTDSTPALEGKLHLNYKNPVGLITNTVVPWTNAVEFFTQAADLMLRKSIDGTVRITNQAGVRAWGRPLGIYYRISDTLVRTNFSITNLQVYVPIQANPILLPSQYQNEYTPTIHRILQVAANIYDNMNDKGTYPHPPTVFVPNFARFGNSVIISGFTEATDDRLLNRTWRDVSDAATNTVAGTILTNNNFYGQHMVIGAKKGHPNFNELALQANVGVSRKLNATRQNVTSTNLLGTNQMFVVNMEHRWGMEAWNSYSAAYGRNLRVAGEVISHVILRDGTNLLNPPVFDRIFSNSMTSTINQPWNGAKQFLATNLYVLFDQSLPMIREWAYTATNRLGTARFNTNSIASWGPVEPAPQFILYTTNKVRFWLIGDNRIIDFASFDNLVTQMDLRKLLSPVPTRNNQAFGSTNITEEMFWDPTPLSPGNPFTVGHSNQMMMAAGEFNRSAQELGASEALWRPYGAKSPDKRGAISVWRKFSGLEMRAEDDRDARVPPELSHQVPFTPTRQIRWELSWQVNDPLVHYMHEDLREYEKAEALSVLRTSRPEWNIGLRNKAYHPWGGNTDQQAGEQDEFADNIGLQDPGIRTSDDWEFPVARKSTVVAGNTNYFYPNIGALGQVHRGTPWQTLYLKSVYRRNPAVIDPLDGKNKLEMFVDPSLWARWAGGIGTFPSRDWRLFDVFTTAVNENAARGLLSVNQTNSAAWGAVLGGTVVATNVVRTADIRRISQFQGVPAAEAFDATVVAPGSPQLAAIVASINDARTNQMDIVRHPNPGANPGQPFVPMFRTNHLVNLRESVFEHMGDVLGAPALSVQNPYLVRDLEQVQKVWTDKAVEYMPSQILSLLRRDEPRFVVYAFGQSLKPAPRSLTSDPNFYHMCTNYQITGEVITKTTFRVEGEPFDPQVPPNLRKPLRTVVEKYELLPPAE